MHRETFTHARRVPTLLLALLLAAVAFAGCHDLGATTQEHGTSDDPDDPDETDPQTDGSENGTQQDEDDTQNETPPPERRDLRLGLSPVPGPVFPGENLNLSVSVDGDNASADWAGIRWSLQSTDDTAVQDLRPNDFDGSSATEDTELESGYTVDWTPQTAATHYLRAHLEADGFHYWSDEIIVEVTPIVEEGDWEANETVRMRTNLLEPCDGDNYSVESLQIEVGEVVAWTNAASCPHTATEASTDPLWDTGQIEANNDSKGYLFNKPGTYEYRCSIHPDMRAQIVVE